ncbi:MAG TPA: hypothetical protein VKH45_11755 [Candidatus Acidoferrum sp.]|nr:hypothetical protein [Candidatus Acidoferrum sp.]
MKLVIQTLFHCKLPRMQTRSSAKTCLNLGQDRILLYLSLAFFVFVIGTSWHRLFIGANHTDEAAYIAMPYRLWLGDRPLIDEYWVSQFPAILLEPFVGAYVKLTGSTEGIILFFRHIYLVFNIATALVFVWVLAQRPHEDRPQQDVNGLPLWAAVLVGALCIGFVPYGIFNLGYNELGMGFLEIGTLLLFSAIARNTAPERVQARRRFLGGLFHGLAIVSYPTLLMGIAVFALVLLPWRRWRRIAFLSYLLGTAIGGGWSLLFVLRVSREQLRTAVNYMLSCGQQGGGLPKFVSIFSDFYHFLPHKGVLLTLTVAILILTRLGVRHARLGLLLLPAILATAPLPASFFGPLLLMRNVAILAPIPLVLAARNPLAQRVFLLLWCPGMIAGMVTAWSSDNGAWNFAIGGFLATIASGVLFWIALAEEGQRRETGRTACLWKSAGFLAISSIATLSVLFQLSSAYGEADLTNARVRIDFGPLRGIFTTPEKYNFYRRLNDDVTSLAPRSTILFFYGLHLGYLITPMRPLVQSLAFPNPLDVPKLNPQIAISYFSRRRTTPDYIVKVNTIPFGPAYAYQSEIMYAADDPLVRLAESPAYKRIIHNDQYEIFSRTR